MHVTFLGTGTSTGVPMIGCECAVCTSPDPRDQRTRCSLLIEAPQGTLLIDTTPDLRQQALRHRLRTVHAVLYTHAHADHIFGFDDLRRFCDANDGLIPIHACPDTLATLHRAFAYAFNGQNRYPGYVVPDPHPFGPEPFELCGLTVRPLQVPHGKIPTWGFRFDAPSGASLAYFCDCKCLPLPVIDAIRAVDVLILDAVRFEPHPTHISLPEAIETAHRAEARRVYFTHLAHSIAHAAVDPTLPAGMSLAFDGLRVSIP